MIEITSNTKVREAVANAHRERGKSIAATFALLFRRRK